MMRKPTRHKVCNRAVQPQGDCPDFRVGENGTAPLSAADLAAQSALDPAGAQADRSLVDRCLAGDVAGDYSFDQPLQIGDRLVFDDMIHYTMVKTTFFNGVKHPSIAHRTPDGAVRVVRTFGFDDFKRRLG